MAELPSGTVTLLFSDIEGSTSLLARLGSAYGEFLTAEREMLRAAWASHDGTELGTEGDSFFVAFPTAAAAVLAAAAAQHSLAKHPWPDGASMRVRMGIHTGSPSVLDGGYVGMDVHRAARVAGAAHGGQVLVSAATAELARDTLPDGIGLRDLGRHRLKDIPSPLHVFQLAVDGLQVEFPALKSLGAASSLPVPATPLVGRIPDIAALTDLFEHGARLVTLTGPGGSGKTRLAIEVAQRLVASFPDGVYFTPLAAATTPDAMWMSIGERLGLPPDARTPPEFFAHVEHRRALFVLDNLEQLAAADLVVAKLLAVAPHTRVLATSRRPLHVAGEFERPVPGLELPPPGEVEPQEPFGAVELFVERAHRVRPGFALTRDNHADVAEICRRLDGLPLAIELAASRAKILNPHALLARMEGVLDLATADKGVVGRHRTLRDTIAWSDALLTSEEQVLFRQLSVFAGGAGVDTVMRVMGPHGRTDGSDPLDLVASLVDANLVTVTDSGEGEPRIGMLETIRMFGRDQLAATGELESAQARHAQVFLEIAEEQAPRFDGSRHLEARQRIDIEHDNMREALAWVAPADPRSEISPERGSFGLHLCAALEPFWRANSYYREGVHWLRAVIDRSGEDDEPNLARCLAMLANFLVRLGEYEQGRGCATASVEMWRRLGDVGGLAQALRALGNSLEYAGDAVTARPAYEEALQAARSSNDPVLLHRILGYVAAFEASEHNDTRSLELDSEALAIARDLGDSGAELAYQHNIACTLRILGRVEEADDQMCGLIPRALRDSEPAELAYFAEDYAAVCAELGRHELALRLIGAAESWRAELGTPRPSWQEAEIAPALEKSAAALSTEEWKRSYQRGRDTAIDVALAEAAGVMVRG